MKKKRKTKAPGDRTPTSAAVKALRVQEVLSLKLNGAEFYDLQEHAREQQWNLSDRSLWRYWAAADELLTESLERDREKLIRRHIAQRRSLYARALNDGDYRTALAIAKDEAELQNLYSGLAARVEALERLAGARPMQPPPSSPAAAEPDEKEPDE